MSIFTNKKNNEKKIKLEDILSQNKEYLGFKIRKLFSNFKDQEQFFYELEEILITADVGIEPTLELINQFKKSIRNGLKKDELQIKFKKFLSQVILEKYYSLCDNKLNILFVLGVNGVGKTSSIGKLAHLMKFKEKSVMLAACDTFRAGAIEQLIYWANYSNIPVIRGKIGHDSGAVFHDALDSAVANKMDLLIVDTGGRLHNKINLIYELKKLQKIIKKKNYLVSAKNLLVLDATTGQNALVQAKTFHEYFGIDSVILTKMDSTSKGGILIALNYKLKLTVQFFGIGENITDLIPFQKENYINSLF